MKKKLQNAFYMMMRIREVGVVIPIIIAVIIFAANNPTFLAPDNIVSILRNMSFVFITAIGMTYLITSGAFDLSVGPVYAFAGVFAATLMQNDVHVVLSILIATVFTGVFFGSMNGFFVVKIGVPPMLATLATMNIARGIVTGVQKGNPVYPLPPGFTALGQGSFFKGSAFELPYVVAIALGLGIIAVFALKYTVYGRMICAVGGNKETSRHAGIPTQLVQFSVFILISLLASLAGILTAARLDSAQPGVGTGYEMQTIASVVIGGTSLAGGVGTVVGTFLGALFMSTISNGMTLIRISPFWQQFVLGLVLFVACSLDFVRSRLKK